MTDKDKYVIYKMFMFVMRALMLLLLRAPNHEKQDLWHGYQNFCKLLNEKYWLDRDDPS